MESDTYKIALVVPLFCDQKEFRDMIVEYLGFGYLAAYLRKNNVQVDIIDAFVQKKSVGEVVAQLEAGQYDLLGFTLMSSDYFKSMGSILDKISYEIIERSHIMVGGYYTTFKKDTLFEMDGRINSIIVGEGENTVLELVERLAKKQGLAGVRGIFYKENNVVYKNINRPLITEQELNALPFPARDNIHTVINENGSVQVLSSRGCFGRCTFCAVNFYYNSHEGRNWRGRSPENVVAEIEELVLNYGVRYIHFTDEEFIGPGVRGRKRACKIAELIIEKQLDINFSMYCRADNVEEQTFLLLKKAGLDSVFLGVEFGVQDSLDRYLKGITVAQIKKALSTLESLKIKTKVGYMMFEPLIQLEEFRESLRFCFENLKFTLRRVMSQMAIYPNSGAYYRLKDKVEFDEQLTFDPLFGDHLKYKFKDEKVEFLFRMLKESLPVISPSKKYLEIMNERSKERKNALIKQWSSDVYHMIDEAATQISIESNLTEKNLMSYSSSFKERLEVWDRSWVAVN